MAFKLALIELVDRYCIAQVKLSILGNNQEEFDFYREQLSNEFDISSVEDDLTELTDIHRRIWEMEDDFKKCVVELKYPLEEIGRRAILIRDINKDRYAIKNRIAEKLNDPIREKKRYHDQVIG
jgi:hypothetical protein